MGPIPHWRTGSNAPIGEHPRSTAGIRSNQDEHENIGSFSLAIENIGYDAT